LTKEEQKTRVQYQQNYFTYNFSPHTLNYCTHSTARVHTQPLSAEEQRELALLRAEVPTLRAAAAKGHEEVRRANLRATTLEAEKFGAAEEARHKLDAAQRAKADEVAKHAATRQKLVADIVELRGRVEERARKLDGLRKHAKTWALEHIFRIPFASEAEVTRDTATIGVESLASLLWGHLSTDVRTACCSLSRIRNLYNIAAHTK
jgi:hypothetical protein